MAARVVDQTQRRVLLGEDVSASDKVISLFETNTDIKVALDGGFAFKDNLKKAKGKQIKDVCFTKKNAACKLKTCVAVNGCTTACVDSAPVLNLEFPLQK